MKKPISLYEAKTHLSSLVDQAAEGEEIIISKNGIPLAKLVAYPAAKRARRPANAGKVSYIAPDFDALDSELIAQFEGP